jgi:L-histidine N-alpha-methyltransferase
MKKPTYSMSLKNNYQPKINDNDNNPNIVILQDYLEFFSANRWVDMLPYAYLASGTSYDNLIKYNSDYYPFNDEVKLIRENGKSLNKYLKDVKDIVELGPGSKYSVKHKTLPLLNYADELVHYCAIDISKKYLKDACDLINESLPSLEINTLEADILHHEKIALEKSYGKKCVLLLGSTLNNFNDQHQDHIIKQFSHLTQKDDVFILTIDTTQDEDILLEAYSNDQIFNLIRGILKFYAEINNEFSYHIDSFEIKSRWNKELKFIDIYFVAKKDFSFKFDNNKTFIIKAGQEFSSVKCRKPDQKNVISLAENNGFSLIDVLQEKQICMFIFKKI